MLFSKCLMFRYIVKYSELTMINCSNTYNALKLKILQIGIQKTHFFSRVTGGHLLKKYWRYVMDVIKNENQKKSIFTQNSIFWSFFWKFILFLEHTSHGNDKCKIAFFTPMALHIYFNLLTWNKSWFYDIEFNVFRGFQS